MLDRQVRGIIATTEQDARNPIIVGGLHAADRRVRERASNRLRALPNAPQLLARDVVDSASRRWFAWGAAADRAREISPADLVGEVPPGGGIAAFRRFGDIIAYPAIAPVLDGGRLLGHYMEWRRFAGATGGAATSSKLMGHDAVVLLGTIGGTWTDLGGGTASPPPVADSATGTVLRYSRDGVKRIARVVTVAQTPWLLVIEFPEATALAPTRRLLLQLTEIAIIALALSFLAAFLISHRLTRPLIEATRAADAIRDGDYTRRLTVYPEVELRRLALAFNHMVERVQRIKPLFTSGYAGDEIVRRGVLESGVAFLEKPYTSASLLRNIREVLEAPSGAALSAGAST